MDFSNDVKKIIESTKTNNSQPVDKQTGFSASVQEIIGQTKASAPTPSYNRYQTVPETPVYAGDVYYGKNLYESDRADYQAKIKPYTGTMAGLTAGSSWLDLGKQQTGVSLNRSGWDGKVDAYTENMDEPTLNRFYSLYGKDPEKAINEASLWQKYKAYENAANRPSTEEAMRQLGLIREETPRGVAKGLATAGDAMVGALGMFGTPIDVASAVVDSSKHGGHFSEDFIAGNKMPITTAINESVTSNKDKIVNATPALNTDPNSWVNKYLGIENWAASAYDIVNSSIQSLVVRQMGMGGLAFFFTSSAMSSLQESLQTPGYSEDKAVAKALLAGLAEVVFEEVSLENVLKPKNSKGFVNRLLNVLKAAGIEASEETATELANKLNNYLLDGGDEEFEKAKAEYLAAGKSNTEAAALALAETIGPEMFSGFLSGLAMSGVATAGHEISTNAKYDRTISQAQKSGTYQELLDSINATDYMEGREPLTDQTKTKEVRKAYRGSAESLETAAIKARLESQGVPVEDSQRFADIIFNMGNGYATKFSERNSLTPEAQKVADEYEKGDADWIRDARSLQHYYATNTTPKGITEKGIEFNIQRAEDEEREYRREGLSGTAKEIGLDIEEVLDEHANLENKNYATKLKTAYEYGSLGFKLEKVTETTGLDASGIIAKAYERGVKKFIEGRQDEQSIRVNIKSGDAVFLSQDYLDTRGAGYEAVDLNKLDKRQKLHIAYLSKVVAPILHRRIAFFAGDISDNGWRNKDMIAINVNGAFETDAAGNLINPGNILGIFMHEFGHELRADSRELYDELRQIVINDVYKGDTARFEADIEQRLKERNEAAKDNEEFRVDPEGAEEEIICDMLAKIAENPDNLGKVFEGHKNLAQRLADFIKKIADHIRNALKELSGDKNLNQYAEMVDVAALDKMVDVLQRYVEQAASQPVVETEAKEQYVKTHELHNVRYEAKHREDLDKHFSEESLVSKADLIKRTQAVMDMWNEIGGELNSEFLNAWNNKDYTNRAFTIFKEQMGYKYAGELASMCKKGIPLFEAIDTIVRDGAMERLKKKTLGPAEKEILYAILKNNGFDIPCAICYVEQARRREGTTIDRFVNGEKSSSKLGWNTVIDDIEKRMKALGVDYAFPTASDSIMTELYKPADTDMDEQTQRAFYQATMDACNKEIEAANEKVEDANKRRELLTSTDPKEVEKKLGGSISANLKIFKVLLQNVDARFRLKTKHLYNSQTTLNLSYCHHALYSLFNQQGGNAGYKTKQGTVVYAGDILDTNWDRGQMRIELGLRSQSNSDFQMYTLVDKAQMLVDLTAKGYYAHEYTKVPSNVQLFGLSGIKQLMSSIAKVVEYKNEDGSVDVERTMENAGLDENGNPIFDHVEGINTSFAFMIAGDKNYSKNVGVNCIGYSDKHIIALLNDPRIAQVIGFHDNTKDPNKRYRGAKYAKNYRGINEAKDASGETVHLTFSEFLDKAEQELKTNPNTDVPRRAVELYFEFCESKHYTPAYNIPGIVDHPNYYKLLCDFTLYDSEGNYAPMNQVAFNMPTEVPALDSNGNKVMIKTEDLVRDELRKEILLREDLAVKMPSMIDDFVQIANGKKALPTPAETSEQHSIPRTAKAPTFYSQMGKVIEQQKSDKFDARSLINMLLGKGVKAEEIKWSGIIPFLDGKKSVTKAELLEFVRGSMLQVEDEWLTDSNWDSNSFDDYFSAENHTYSEAQSIVDEMWFFDELKDKKAAMDSIRVDFEDDIFYAYAKIDGEERMILKYNPRERATRWAQYTLPGTMYYRELKLKMPDADYSNKAMKVHWNESGILAHARVDDAIANDALIDPETGEVHPIFFIEEIQSDWHNAGNKGGYLSAEDAHKRTEGVKDLDGLKTLIEYSIDHPSEEEFEIQVNDILANMGSTMRIENHEPGYLIYDEGLLRSSCSSQRIALRRLIDILNEDAPAPEAPFKNGKYIEFVMKKLLRTAAEEGYNKIGWTTAKQQAERWSDAYAEGYRIEYDQDIPKFLNKYGKQWGAKVGQEELDNGEIVWTFPINETMRNSVIFEGQPMYSLPRIRNNTTIKSGSLYSGGGLLEQGLEYQLLTHEFGVEIVPSIAATWKENNGDGKIYAGDTEGDVNNFDGRKHRGKMFHIHASPICHNLSPAKKGWGEQPSDIESAKKTLQIFLDAAAPVYTVENAEYYEKTQSARIIKEGLEQAGYTVDIGVYDSADYGSAQSRRRTIIRAVRADLEMPAKPRTLPRGMTWDNATRDLWDGLTPLKASDIAPSYLKAVKNTGIDINNVKVPTLLQQTVKGGKVTFAEEGTQCHTLTTHCDESKLLLPGGKIYDVTPQFMGRLMGLPDDFKYPHFKNGKTKTSVAYEIIGNGIPVELTKAVIGGVIESAYEQTEGETLHSVRRMRDDGELTPRQYLAAAAMEVTRNAQEKADLQDIIDRYDDIYEDKARIQAKIEKLVKKQNKSVQLLADMVQAKVEKAYQEHEDVKAAITQYGTLTNAINKVQAQIEKQKSELTSLRTEEGQLTQALHDIVSTPQMESIIEQQRQALRKSREELAETKEANAEKIKRLREQANERRAKDYYLPRLNATVKELGKNLKKSPEPFRAPVYRLLAALDFTTKDKNGNIKENQANANRVAVRQALTDLFGGDETADVRAWFKENQVDIDERVLQWVQTMRNMLDNIAEGNSETFDLRTASADEIGAVYHLFKYLNTVIKQASKSYTNANLDMSEVGEGIGEHADSLGTKTISSNRVVQNISKFFAYDNATPITVADRLGDFGRKWFSLLQDGQDKLSANEREVLAYTSKWDKKTIRHWIDTTAKVKFENEKEPVTMTLAEMMALYCASRDEDGRWHLVEGAGFKLAKMGATNEKVERRNGKKRNVRRPTNIVEDDGRRVTETDLENLAKQMNEIDERMIPFAEDLQKFLDETGAKWINQVTIKRFGYRQAVIENYFPLTTVAKESRGDISNKFHSDFKGRIYGLLNRSFVQDRIRHANNALVINDIFDVFTEHMADTALYNAFALPILDTARMLGYKHRNEDGKVEWELESKLNKAYGKEVMQDYIENLLDSINGQQFMTSAETLGLTALRLRNRVAVAANFRVAAQQPFSIMRALDELDVKYFHPRKGEGYKETRDEMLRYSEIANWKQRGGPEAGIKAPLRDEIIGADNAYKRAVNSITEKGMWLAEKGDEAAWTAMWAACKNWVDENHKGLEGDAYFKAVDAKFRDVIYRTQVVDSVLTRSQIMRQQTFFAKMVSAFKSEPTQSYNMLLRKADRFRESAQRGTLKQDFGRLSASMLKSFSVFLLNGLVNALVTAFVDAQRDDDDYESWWEKFREALFGEYKRNMTGLQKGSEFLKSNIFGSINPIEIPYIADILSLFQGYDPDRPDLMLFENLGNTAKAIKRLTEKFSWKDTFKLIDTISQFSGIPFTNMVRDTKSLWNTFAGTIYPDLKVADASSPTAGYEHLYDAMVNGETVKAAQYVDEIMDNVGDEAKAYSGITTQIRNAYKDGLITADEAYKYMEMACDYFDRDRSEKQLRNQINGW